MLNLRNQAIEVLQLLPQTPVELVNAVQSVTSAPALADLIASFMDITPAEKQEILETVDIERRLDRVSAMLAYRIEVLRLSRQISEQTKEKIDDRQREFLLREQMKTIQKELGEGDDAKSQEIAELAKKIAEAKMPPEVEEHAKRELARLERMPEAAGEYSMARTYLEWLIELPWSIESGKTDRHRRGPPHPRRRPLRPGQRSSGASSNTSRSSKLNPGGRSPILCFVGPPGVGKTSLGQSIARATGRKFVRVSLGGTHDEAEIRGHRRTYIGALPGNIIQGIRRAGSRDCVMMLDEIDKLGRGIQGDPSSALLEVLDPEQNSTFRDNYLGVPFDLSRVMFITTANVLDTIPGPLRDRMEVIDLPGYVEDEKFEIARRYLVARQLKANGLTSRAGRDQRRGACARSSATIPAKPACASSSARSARCCAAPRCTSPRGPRGRSGSSRSDLTEILGPPRFEGEVAMRTSVPGVATGLAWTPVGGDILFIEATRIPRRRPADPDRPARRGHARERTGGAEPGQGQGVGARARSRDVRQERHPHPRPGRRHPQGRAERRGGDVHRAGLAVDQPDRAQRHRDDRRDQPARPGAAGRRHQGKGRRRRPRRALDASSCRRATARITRRSRRPRATACAFSGPSGSRR